VSLSAPARRRPEVRSTVNLTASAPWARHDRPSRTAEAID
jgi:hypothetical protein